MFFSKRRSGDLISLASNDVPAIQFLFENGIVISGDAIILSIGVVASMCFLSPKLALFCILPLSLMPFLVRKRDTLISRCFAKMQASFSTLTAWAKESFAGIKVIKANAREKEFHNRFANIGDQYVETSLKLAWLESSFGPTLELLMVLSLIVLFFVGGNDVLAGTITIGTFVAFQRYIQQLQWPLEAVGLSVSAYQKGKASSERINQVFEEDSEIGGAQDFQASDPILQFDHVGFKYHDSESPLLTDVSFSLPRGSWTALVGDIGSGKSSVLDLITGIEKPTSGIIRLGDKDIAAISLEALRAAVSYLPQEIYLFNDTVINNIKIAKPGAASSEIEAAIQGAALDLEIKNFPDGINTLLGERGINISGGQRQRLGLARVLLNHSALVLLDDPFSSIDLNTEAKILNQLQRVFAGKTVLLSASRGSTIRYCNQILVLQGGRVIEQGSCQDLLKIKNGWFAAFWKREQLREELENVPL